MLTATSPKQLIQEFILGYLQLSDAKKGRVDKLFEMLKRAPDPEEQREIAQAIQEIVSPVLPDATAIVNAEEGLDPNARQKVDAYRQHIGRAVRNRRKDLGMTQEQLAEKAGLPQSHISRIESGVHAPTDMTIEKLATALEVEPSRLDLLYS